MRKRGGARRAEPRTSSQERMRRLCLQPAIAWGKGHAVLWPLERLDLDRPAILPISIGDDLTDEDALEALPGRGAGIVVRRGA